MSQHPENRGQETDLDLRSLPTGFALSWGLVKPPSRGPKGELSIRKIVDAAVAIADKDGLAAVSMSRVASSLGYTTMSLYRYISSKDDLLLLMQEAACDMPIPPVDPAQHWRDAMRTYVSLTVDVFRRHPWFGDIPITGVPSTPNHLAIVDWALRPLRGFPLSDYEKMSIVLLVSTYVRSIGIIQRDIERAMSAGAGQDIATDMNHLPALKHLVTAERYPDLYPVVMSGTYAGEHDAEDAQEYGDDFHFGLERILDGIEQYLARKGAGT